MNSLTTDGTIEKEWIDAIERHRITIADYIQTVAAYDEQAWRVPVASAKWTPAQITDHLILSYKVTLGQLRGEQRVKMVYNFLLRSILRLTVLPRIFRNRRLPSGARAPEEMLPEDASIPRETALEYLTDVSGEFETEIFSIRNDKKLRLTHHIFGEIKPLEGLNLLAIHVAHHARQLPRSLE